MDNRGERYWPIDEPPSKWSSSSSSAPSASDESDAGSWSAEGRNSSPPAYDGLVSASATHLMSREKALRKAEKKRKRESRAEDGVSKSSKKARAGESNAMEIDAGMKEGIANLPQLSHPFLQLTASLNVALSPVSQLHPLEGLCAEHLSPLILTYFPPFKAVVVSFDKPRLSETPCEHNGVNQLVLATASEADGVSLVWLTADFILFKPEIGHSLEANINLQSESHLGLLFLNLFNISIERRRLPPAWTWSPVGGEASKLHELTGTSLEASTTQKEDRGEGYYIDEAGNMVQGTVRFRIKDFEISLSREKGFINFEGTMLDEASEKRLLSEEAIGYYDGDRRFSRHGQSASSS